MNTIGWNSNLVHYANDCLLFASNQISETANHYQKHNLTKTCVISNSLEVTVKNNQIQLQLICKPNDERHSLSETIQLDNQNIKMITE